MILENDTFNRYGYKVNELSRASRRSIVIQCDFCNEIKERPFLSVMSGRNIILKDCCEKRVCIDKKRNESIEKRYGVKKLSDLPQSQHKEITLKGTQYTYLICLENGYYKESYGQITQFVKCKCICGNELEVNASNLKRGKNQSCGCKRFELIGDKVRRHGDCGSKLHRVWSTMRQRCNNPKNKSYKSYGLKGVKICDEWNNYSNFKEWAENNGYKNNVSLDRINSNKLERGYSPENCQWISLSENSKRITGARDERIIELELENETLKKRVEELQRKLNP